MKATIERLLQKRYLSKIINTIRNKIPPEQGWFLEDDLIQETRRQIAKVLPTKRGAGAETAWVAFCYQCMIDAWRENFGRNGERLKIKIGGERVTITKASVVASNSNQNWEENFGKQAHEVNPVETLSETDSLSSASWHVGLKENQTELIEKIVENTIDKIQEPLLKLIAADQFGDDPSPISSGTSKNRKPPLTELTNLSRHQIASKIAVVRAILAGNLLANRELDIDTERLKKYISNEKLPKKIKRSYAQSKRGD